MPSLRCLELLGEPYFGRSFVVEALHLTDETMEVVTITGKKLDNRQTETDQMLARIAAGSFTPKLDAVIANASPNVEARWVG